MTSFIVNSANISNHVGFRKPSVVVVARPSKIDNNRSYGGSSCDRPALLPGLVAGGADV